MSDQDADKLRAFLQQRKKKKESASEPEKSGDLNQSSHSNISETVGVETVERPIENEAATKHEISPEKVTRDTEQQSVDVKPDEKPQVAVLEPSNKQSSIVEQPVTEQIMSGQVAQPVSEPKSVQTPQGSVVENPSAENRIDEAEMQSQLKAYLNQRRKTVRGGDDDADDPYSGDGIAKKNLRHLQKYLDRDDIADIKEIVINQPCEVGLEFADGHWDWIRDPDLTQNTLDEIARTLANKSGQLFHPGNPILSVKMPGGHRVQVVSGFNAPSGFVFSMRLQRKEKFGLNDFQMPDEEREKIKEIVRSQKTILLSGGTGTGKTSFMNALIPSIPEDERLVTMEDVPELRIPHKNWAQLIFSGSDTAVGDQGVLELLNACLRLRPDRIILGEIRKENAFAFCSAINTGHEGSMATIHANTPKMALDAVINRVMMNGDLPDSAMQVLRRQLIHDIYAVVQLTRIHKGVKAELTILGDDSDV